MKKAILIAACLLALLLLCSCQPKETPNHTANTGKINVTFINGCSDADVWILPDTETNRASTLWGTATVPVIKSGESRQTALGIPGENGFYLLRVIDVDQFYYSAEGITLGDGWRMQLKEDENHVVTLDVTDESGALQQTYEVFSAHL